MITAGGVVWGRLLEEVCFGLGQDVKVGFVGQRGEGEPARELHGVWYVGLRCCQGLIVVVS